MALAAPTALSAVGAQSAGATSSITSASISPASDCLLIVTVYGVALSTQTISSISTTLSNVGTWTIVQRTDALAGAYQVGAIAYAKVTGAPGTGTVTANYSNSQYTAVMTVASTTGHDLTTPVAQSQSGFLNTGSPLTLTLGSTPAASSMVFAGFVRSDGTEDPQAMAPDTGFTELQQVAIWNSLGLYLECETQYDLASADTTVAMVRDSFATLTGFAIEINEAASTVTGSAAITLAAFASTASGTTVTGTSAQTLATFMASASGASGASGTSAQTLRAFTSTASGSTVSGTSAQTLAAATSSAAGTHSISGTAAATLDAFTSSAAGQFGSDVTGTSASTLAAFTSTAAGSTVTGTSAQELAAATSSASGTHSISGSSAQTLAAFTSSAAGQFGNDITGSSAQTLDAFTGAAAGSTVVGSSAQTLDAATSTASGTHSISGTSAQTLAAFTSSASGTFATAPGAPTKVRPSDAFGYSSTVTLDWDAPASDGGSAITDYVVQWSTNDGGAWTTYSDGTSTTSAATLTGLTPGTRYTFRVAAVNAVGQGDYTESDWGCTPVTATAALTTPTGTTATSMPWGPSRIDERTDTSDTSFRRAWTGAGVRVYVVDSGIRTTHDAFDSRTGSLVNAFTFNGTDYDDNFNHGTSVASVLGSPVVGIAPGCDIYNVKVQEGTSGTPTSAGMTAGFQWIIDNHPAGTPGVVTASTLYSNASPGNGPDDLDPLVDEIINTLGLAWIQCTGNTFSPANDDLTKVPGLIYVGGTEDGDTAYADNDYTPTTIDIFAPSAAISSATNVSDSAYSNRSGTSFGTPMVAGVAAMWLEANPDLTPRQIEDLVKASSTKDVITDLPDGFNNFLLYSLADVPPQDVTGASAQTLAAFTSSATGAFGVDPVGTVAATLASFTGAATGSSVVGSSATTNAAATSAATGAVGAAGTASATLEAYTSSATGTVLGVVSGSAGATLADFLAAAGGSSTSGAVAQTLAAFTSTATGTAQGLVVIGESTYTAHGTRRRVAVVGTDARHQLIGTET